MTTKVKVAVARSYVTNDNEAFIANAIVVENYLADHISRNRHSSFLQQLPGTLIQCNKAALYGDKR